MKLKATVAYTGGGFHGFAVNEGVRTVAGELEAALGRIAREPITITCAGRTDKGVHGWGQVISFELPSAPGVAERFEDLGRLRHSLNKQCGPDIAVRDLAVVEADFDARFSATWRQYRYVVLNTPVPDPFQVGRAWHVPESLDVDSMTAAARHLVGTHDFASFCRRPSVPAGQPEASLVRAVLEAEWVVVGEGTLEFWVRATAFCHQQVRSFVGTTVDVGLGRIAADDIPSILEARDRTAAGRVAPPDGLTLWAVGY